MSGAIIEHRDDTGKSFFKKVVKSLKKQFSKSKNLPGIAIEIIWFDESEEKVATVEETGTQVFARYNHKDETLLLPRSNAPLGIPWAKNKKGPGWHVIGFKSIK